MRNQDQSPLMDRRTLIAILLIGVFMMGWQHLMNLAYPPKETKPVIGEVNTPQSSEINVDKSEEKTASSLKSAVVPPEATIRQETLMTYEDEKVRFTVSNYGMGFKEFISKSYKDSEQNPVRLGFSPEALLYEFSLVGQKGPIDFDFKEAEPGFFIGTAYVGEAKIHRTFRYDPKSLSLASEIRIEGWSDLLKEGLVISIPDMIHAPASSSWLFPSYDHQDFFTEFGGKKNTVNFNHAKENVEASFPTASLVSVGNQYFTLAMMDRSTLSPSVIFKADIAGKTALASVIYKPAPAELLKFEQVFYAGPKSIDVLKRIDPAMAEIVDFGYLAFIAKPLLYILKWSHGLVGNWGLAIIILTIIVRFVVLPFNLMSARSMKAMQRIQPLMKDLREKHKEDPMTLNREMMNLMKEHKANPIGGCLPVLFQIPIFFALFRVIGSTVELYQSPFVWWIQDLSAHDHWFVLPLILGATMYLQQKMTPTTMDPAQAKIMAFLPVVFTVFMLYLPSGLTLYMVVSAVFGIIQQWYILKDSPAPVPVKK